jgi:hypothetical protein
MEAALRLAARRGLLLLPDACVRGLAKIDGEVLRFDVAADAREVAQAILRELEDYSERRPLHVQRAAMK